MSRLEPVLPAVLSLWRETGVCHWIITSGESMQPLIRGGDRLLVLHDLARIRQGSIVVFEREGRLVAHRVLQTMPGRLLTQGDNARTPDQPVAENCVVGHVLAMQRGARRIELDTAAWRWVGRSIAIGLLTLQAIERQLTPLKSTRLQTPLMAARVIHRGLRRSLRSLILVSLSLGRSHR